MFAMHHLVTPPEAPLWFLGIIKKQNGWQRTSSQRQERSLPARVCSQREPSVSRVSRGASVLNLLTLSSRDSCLTAPM